MDSLRNCRLALLLLFCIFLSACGSGGGASGSSGQVTIVGNTTGVVSVQKAAVQLGETITVSATFKKSDGTPAVGVPVTFTSTMGTITPTNGIATTDASGVASVVLTAGSTSGQGQVTAVASVENKTISANVLFTVNLPALHLGNVVLTPTSGSIDYGSSMGVSVTVLDANGNVYQGSQVDVLFTSTQAALGKATINSPVATVNGVATTTYSAVTAVGSDTITASIAGYNLTIPITINPLSAGSISYVSSVPTTIGLRGMGGYGVQESSKVTFKVLDTSGAPKANQPVNFALNTTVGGLYLMNTTGSTAADGTVSTIVRSGIVATPVRVTATTTVGSTVLSTQSDQLVVSTGIPSQDGFSLGPAKFTPEAWHIAGVAVPVTVRLSDHFHNPVPDGTAVYFTTNGGMIEPSCTTVKGTCTVNWTSGAPWPVGDKTLSTPQNDGRARILAYAVGEEYFLDLNGNGLCDPTDTWRDNPEAFRDDNENNVRDSYETFIDFNGDGAFNNGDGMYNGVLQGTAYASAAKTKNVFANTTIVMSSSTADIWAEDSTAAPTGYQVKKDGTVTPISSPGTFFVNVTDENGNSMPAGTKVEATSPFGKLTGDTSWIMIDDYHQGGVKLSFFIAAADTPKSQSGMITVKVTSPAGAVTRLYIPISGMF